MTAQKVISVPTDRSMPPVMMTKVQAIASTPLTAVACRMPSMLSICMKAGEAKLKKTISRIRLAKASSFWRAVEPKTRARKAAPARSSVPAVAVFDCHASARISHAQAALAVSRCVASCMIRSCVASFACKLAGDAAFAHHHDAVAHAQDLRQLRGDHHDRLALVGERAQQLVDLGLGADVDAARRLVEEQDVAIAHQPFGDHDLLLVAAREKPHLLRRRGRADVEKPDELVRRSSRIACLREEEVERRDTCAGWP